MEAQTDRVLSLLAKHRASATFFVMGWVAERHSAMMRRILEAGHEIGCHSYAHQLVYGMTPEEFRADTRRAVGAIQDAVGVTPRLYRAPSYSITRRSFWALEILAECGFTHDSSIYPVAHDRYGIPGFERRAHTIGTASGPILEVPVAAAKLGASIVPVGGGAYLRLLPYRFTAAGIRRINREERRPACIYFHPWEIDPEQPRLAAGLVSRLRTYTGLRGMERKLAKMLRDFQFLPMTAVYPNTRVVRETEREASESGCDAALPATGQS